MITNNETLYTNNTAQPSRGIKVNNNTNATNETTFAQTKNCNSEPALKPYLT